MVPPVGYFEVIQLASQLRRKKVFGIAHKPCQPVAVDQVVGGANDNPRLYRAYEQEWKAVNKGMAESRKIPLSFVLCLPITLQDVISYQMQDKLLHNGLLGMALHTENKWAVVQTHTGT
jgi:hypothetical protein